MNINNENNNKKLLIFCAKYCKMYISDFIIRRYFEYRKEVSGDEKL